LVAVVQASPILSPITIYSTGAGTPGTPDPNFTLISTPAHPVTTATTYVVDKNGFPIATGQWDTADYGTNAKWIAPEAQYNAGQTDAAGNYVYQVSFVIPDGIDPSTVILWGTISSDNCTQGILVNGTAVVWSGGNTSLMVPGTCGMQAHNFEIGGTNAEWQTLSGAYLATSTVFHPGINTIEFVVNNAYVTTQNPTGLIVWWRGAGGYEVPEPAAAGLLAIGLAALALLRRKFFA
jgi:hypothetical protein